MTVNEFVAALGGRRKVAQIAGVRPNAVSNWGTRGAIPPRLYLKFAAACDRLGIRPNGDLFREVRHNDTD